MPHATPEKIKTSQFVHLQPRYSAANPPINGPVTGPFIGPILQILKARARYVSLVMSATVPGEFEIMAAPAQALSPMLVLITRRNEATIPKKPYNENLRKSSC
jgi:hypothetical protein